MSYENVANSVDSVREPTASLSYPQETAIREYLQSHLGNMTDNNSSHFVQHIPDFLHQIQNMPSQVVPPSQSLPRPPFPPLQFSDLPLASQRESQSQTYKNVEPVQVPSKASQSTVTFMNDPRSAGLSSTSEMDLEDGELTDESSPQVPGILDGAQDAREGEQYAQRRSSNHSATRPSSSTTGSTESEMKSKAVIALLELHEKGVAFETLVQEGISHQILEDLYRECNISKGQDDNLQNGDTRPKQQKLRDTVQVCADVTENTSKQRTSTVHPPKEAIQSPIPEQRSNHTQVPASHTTAHPPLTVIPAGQSDSSASRPENENQQPKPMGVPDASSVKEQAPSAKPVDRKDYIARMLEAKKKNLPKAPSLPQTKTPGAKSTASFTPKLDAMSPAAKTPTGNTKANLDPPLSASNTQSVAKAVEPLKAGSGERTFAPDTKALSELQAKKKAQTELARQKMVALMNQNQKRRTIIPTTPLAADQDQGVIGAKDLTKQTSPNGSPPRPDSSQLPGSSVSPSLGTPFSIPGLFTAINQPMVSPKVTSSKGLLSDGGTSLTVNELVQSSAQKVAGEPNVQEIGLLAASMDQTPVRKQTASPSTNLRKRQKAADFIDSPPAKSRRRLGSRDDTDVIIEVSDDELYGDVHEGAPLSANERSRSQSQSPSTEKQRNGTIIEPPSITKPFSLATAPPIGGLKVLNTPRPAVPENTHGLKSKEKTIEDMRRRIAELEQRRKAKSVASGAQTPGSPKEQAPKEVAQQNPASAEVTQSTGSTQPTIQPSIEHSQSMRTFSGAMTPPSGPPTVHIEAVEIAKSPGNQDTIAANGHTESTIETDGVAQPTQLPIRSSPPIERQQPIGAEVRGLSTDAGSRLENDVESLIASSRALGGEGTPSKRSALASTQDKTLLLEENPALPDDQPDVLVKRLRLEQLRAQVAFLEKQIQSMPSSNQPQVQTSDEERLPANEQHQPSHHVVLPEEKVILSEEEANERHAEDPIRASANDVPVEQTSTGDDHMDVDAPEIQMQLLDEPPIMAVEDAQQDDDGYDPAEDAMDLSDSSSEQDEASEGAVVDRFATPDEHNVDDHAPSGEAYEPPTTFETSRSPLATQRVLADDGPQIQDSSHADIVAERHPETTDDLPGEELEDLEPVEPIVLTDSSVVSGHSAQISDRSSAMESSSEEGEYEPPAPTTPQDMKSPTPSNALPPSAQPQKQDTSESNILHQHSPPVESKGLDTTVEAPELMKAEAQAASSIAPIPLGKHFTPYESPLRRFKNFRYHPTYLSEVSQGLRSNTYSNSLDAKVPLCPFATLGTCNDTACKFQHLDKVKLSDDKILAQLVHEPAIKDPEQQENFRAGLRNLISSLRERSIKDFNTLAKEIIAYRQEFLGDKSKILNL